MRGVRVQGVCERRIEGFVKIQKKNRELGVEGVGSGSGWGVGLGSGWM